MGIALRCLDSPIIVEYKVTEQGYRPKQQEELPLKAFGQLLHLATEGSPPCRLMAKLALRILVSGLRYAHAKRAVYMRGLEDGGMQVLEVGRGKAKGRQ
eukprot:6122021-Heterocapsa_arctica.AAC.1